MVALQLAVVPTRVGVVRGLVVSVRVAACGRTRVLLLATGRLQMLLILVWWRLMLSALRLLLPLWLRLILMLAL